MSQRDAAARYGNRSRVYLMEFLTPFTERCFRISSVPFRNPSGSLFCSSMVRLRKEKGQPTLKNPAPNKETKSKAKSGNKAGDTISKEQVLALGGNEEDMELLKGVDEDEVISGLQNSDVIMALFASLFHAELRLFQPSLQKDLSKFLKDLNLHQETPKAKGKGKEKLETPRAETLKPSKEKKDKKNKNAAQKPEAQVAQPKTTAVSSDAPPPKVQLPTKVSLNPKSRFVFQPTSLWHAAVPPLSPMQSKAIVSPDQLTKFSTKAAELHAADVQTFQTSSSANSSSSEASFLHKIIQSGTLSDRLSALTLLVQSSPLHNTKALETLKGMAERGKGKGGREESLKALRCIVDWWVGGGAPNRKLV